MIGEEKIFVILHSEIVKAISKNKFQQAVNRRNRKGKIQGTWLEVITLLENDYRWEGKYQIFLPPTMSLAEFEGRFSVRSRTE